ncbi:heparinase II/III family protein [Natronospora cellulosivora (SeqCode)]
MNLNEIIKSLEYGEKKMQGNLACIFTEVRDAKKLEEVKKDEAYQSMIEEIYDSANSYSSEPIEELPFSIYKLFHTTGSRDEYQKIYFDRRARLSAFAVMVLLDKDADRFIEKLEDILWAICNEYTWALPAHIPGKSFKIKYSKDNNSNIKAELRGQQNTIDLFAAETAFALAEILNLLEEKLSAIVSSRVREEIFNRVLNHFTDLNKSFNWETLAMNWSAVCSGSIGAAAIYLIEDNRKLANIINRVLNCMKVFISGFTEDGACPEGLGYWNYGFGFYTYFAELLKERTAGRIDLMNDSKVKEISLFQQKSYISEDKVLSFSDSPRRVKFHAGLSSRLNQLYSEFILPDMNYKAGFHDDHCYRWVNIIRDIFWFDPKAFQERNQNKVIGDKNIDRNMLSRKKLDQKRDNKDVQLYYLEKAQWLIYKKNNREHINRSNLKNLNKKIVFAAKGGYNDEPHNHNDIASFIYHLGDTSFLVDLGSGQYTKDYFTSKRYEILCNGSQGHSVPIVEGYLQEYGKDFSADICDYKNNEEEIHFSINIKGAYANRNLLSLIRSFSINKNDNSLFLVDKYKFDAKPASITERFISFYEPEIEEDGILLLKNHEDVIKIKYKKEQMSFSCSKDYHINHDGHKELVYFLDFLLRNPTQEELVEFKFIPCCKDM